MHRVRIPADILVGCLSWKAGNVRIQHWSHEAAAAPSPGLSPGVEARTRNDELNPVGSMAEHGFFADTVEAEDVRVC